MNIVNLSHLKKLDRRRVGFTQYTSATPHDNRQTIIRRLHCELKHDKRPRNDEQTYDTGSPPPPPHGTPQRYWMETNSENYLRRGKVFWPFMGIPSARRLYI